jgi:hypothetical protein
MLFPTHLLRPVRGAGSAAATATAIAAAAVVVTGDCFGWLRDRVVSFFYLDLASYTNICCQAWMLTDRKLFLGQDLNRQITTYVEVGLNSCSNTFNDYQITGCSSWAL